MARREMQQLAADLRDLAQEFYEHQHAARGVNPDSINPQDISTEVFVPAPGEVIVVRLPSHADPYLAADLLRFIDAQREATGVTVPVLVTLADAVTTERM